MIEKMKMVHIVTSASGKEEMLKGLRDAGILHLAERQNADRSLSEQFQTLSKAANALKEYEDPKSKEPKAGVLDDAEFEKMYRGVLDAIEKKESLIQAIGAANTELDRISAWGDFSPEEVKALKDEGFDLHFYRMGSKEFQDAVNDENVRLIRLASVDKMDTVAVLGTLPPEIPATEFMLPEQSISDLKAQVETCRKGIAECEETLKAASVYGASFNDQMVKLENRMNYSAAGNTAQSDEDFVWISGYIPEEDLDQFKAMAEEKSLAWAIEDVSEDDENIPTKVIHAVLRDDHRRRRLWSPDPAWNHCAPCKAEKTHQCNIPPLCIVHRDDHMGSGNGNLVRYGKRYEHTVLQETGDPQHSDLSGVLRPHGF